MSSISDNCILCEEPVRERQEGVQCDGCLKWNHRTCNTGISQEEYRAAVRAGNGITWFCKCCHPEYPITESTRDILESEEFNPPVSLSTDFSGDESTVYDPPAQPSIGESTIEDPTPNPVEPVDQPVTFHIVEGASERGKQKLMDSWGYSYNVKRQRVNATDWQCTVRPMVRN